MDVIVTVLLIACLFLTMLRCDILSRRIDLVHERITLNNRMNGLESGAWDREGDAALKARRRDCGVTDDSQRALAG